LSPEAKADLAAQADQKRYARKQTEKKLYEATVQGAGLWGREHYLQGAICDGLLKTLL
jgi:hypothetical protein